jgi:hypothetical protein
MDSPLKLELNFLSYVNATPPPLHFFACYNIQLHAETHIPLQTRVTHIHRDGKKDKAIPVTVF